MSALRKIRLLGRIGFTMLAVLVTACPISFGDQQPMFRKGEAIPSDAIVLFDGKDHSKWKIRESGKPANWKIENGYMVVGGGNLLTKQEFRDCQLHVEFWLSKSADNPNGQETNSGVYLMDDYEVQILDSSDEKPSAGSCGAIYSVSPPKVNAARPAEQWQTFDILFHAPQFDKNGKKITDARMSALHNGVWVHQNVAVPSPTEEHERPCRASGGIRLQDYGHPVRYRNIWIRPL